MRRFDAQKTHFINLVKKKYDTSICILLNSTEFMEDSAPNPKVILIERSLIARRPRITVKVKSHTF